MFFTVRHSHPRLSFEVEECSSSALAREKNSSVKHASLLHQFPSENFETFGPAKNMLSYLILMNGGGSEKALGKLVRFINNNKN